MQEYWWPTQVIYEHKYENMEQVETKTLWLQGIDRIKKGKNLGMGLEHDGMKAFEETQPEWLADLDRLLELYGHKERGKSDGQTQLIL